MKTFVKIIVVLVILGAIGGGVYWYVWGAPAQPPEFRMTPVTRGDIVATIGASGTVEPEDVVDVGAQVAGQIISFGTDADGQTVDFCSPVEENMVLARIDDALYAADAAQAQAQVDSAKAGIERAQADIEASRAKLDQAQRDWGRAQKLGPSDALAQSLYDGYKATYDGAVANVKLCEASLLQAKAAVPQAEAALLRAKRALSYCTIASPVKGVIIARRVNIGQTVVSSLSAPSLFLIAKDLKRMQVLVAVNEADIGAIKQGLPVTFAVDNRSGETFKGVVHKVRYDAAMTQNVVTYTVEVNTDNSDGRLRPYRTANVTFETDHREGVLMVPNAALRYMPATELVAPDARGQMTAGTRRPGAWSATPTTRRSTTEPAGASASRGMVWVRDGAFLRPVRVHAGLTDGVNTEIRG
jgi:HlyD family secretion protein